MSPRFNVEQLISDQSVHTILCTGSGGVGKTTTAAALGVLAASHGRNVIVLTIDPARRLAQALGIDAVGNEPVNVPILGTGSLHAMQLDMKRTFDDIVINNTDPIRAQQILQNPFYQALSSSFAGTQEYMAMEKLGQLHESPQWDLVIVDTPPSRSALDFLDAPRRLGAFLDGRLIRILATPAKVGGRIGARLVEATFGVFGNVLQRVLGAQVLTDIQGFVAAFDTLFSDIRKRADHTYSILRRGDSRFVVVSAPEEDALREASFFVQRLQQDSMPIAGVVLNRMITVPAAAISREQAIATAERLDNDQAFVAGLLRVHADRFAARERQDRLARQFIASHSAIPVISVPELSIDIHDLAGLEHVGMLLTVGSPQR